MKKKLLSLLVIGIMVFGLTACGTKNDETKKEQSPSQGTSDNSQGDTDNSLQYIKDNGQLIMGLDDAFPPMGFRDDANNIVGFDVDLATAVCEKLGVELKLQPVDWEAKEQELNTKNIDCIWNGFSITPERLESMQMSKPYMENELSLVVLNNSTIKDKAGMAGKKLAVQSGSSAEEALNSEENKAFKDSLGDVIGIDDYVTALLELETNQSDAVLIDSVLANYMINDLGKDYVVLDDSLLAEAYGIGFRKGEEALSKAVEDALSELKADGTVEEIATKWFGSDITTIE